jgi:type I restriction-modification system DNA methylase subunit
MSLTDFLRRWEASGASERANAQIFLSELCDVLEVSRPEPTKPRDEENAYVFEKGVTFTHGDGSTSAGRIDLYKRGCFVLEAKQGTLEEAPQAKHGHGKRRSHVWDEAMMRARGQAESYARALPASEGWPPFLVVIDVGYSFEVYADFSRSGKTYTPFPDPSCHRIFLSDLENPEIRDRLRAVWTDPLSLDPSRRSARVTREVADTLANLAKSLEASGFTPRDIFDFLMRAIFTMFAEDVDLLPKGAFTKLLERLEARPEHFPDMLESLWVSMAQGGFSPVLEETLLRFNGGLFEHAKALPLSRDQIRSLVTAARYDWRDVEPAIFGTLVERALNPRDRHKLGAHYTPRAYVERLVLPTIIEPLRADWDAAKAEAQTLRRKKKTAAAVDCLREFHRKLCTLRVLDPACGSGNFLYVTLEHMKRLEAEVLDALAALGFVQAGLELEGVTVSPVQFLGLEINPRAAAIADLVLWIGYLQWHMRTHGGAHPKEPVIDRFHSIECRDALMDHLGTVPVLDDSGRPVTRWDGTTTKTHPVTGEQVPDETATVPVVRYKEPRKAQWPKADFIVGNPPFIGASTMRQALGDGYVEAVRGTYAELPESIDFVMYWWHLAAEKVRAGAVRRFGFITTNSLRQTFNRRVLSPHLEAGLGLAFAIPDHPWVDSSDGAAVRIAMTVGAPGIQQGSLCRVVSERETGEDAAQVVLSETQGRIHADLTTGADVGSVGELQSNDRLTYRGHELGSSGFILERVEAERITQGKHSRFIREYRNGRDLTERPRDALVIDFFGLSALEAQDELPAAFQRLVERVKPEREQNRDERLRLQWWLHRRSREDLRIALHGLPRYIATVETSKHRTFQFLDASICPDNKLVCIALADAYHLGILSSRVHVAFALAAGSRLGVGNDPVYVKSKCFDAFPFPVCAPAVSDRIRQAAERLDAHRKRQQEIHPDLTLTGLYNVLEALREGRALTAKEKDIHEKGLVSVLREIHDELDRAVFEAYGWPVSLSDAEILERLVALNAERAAEEADGLVRWLRPDFQNPATAAAPVQEGLDLGGAPEADPIPAKPKGKAKKASKASETKAPWPEATRDQILTLRTALVFLGASVDPVELAQRFQGAKPEQVAVLLEAMAALGQIREAEGRFAA